MDTLEKELQAFAFRTEIKVQWGELDAANHVNNTVYLRWFETARVDYLQALGYPIIQDESENNLPGIILGKQDCKYLFPVTFPDTIIAGLTITELQTDRFVAHCKMFSTRHQRLVAIANATCVLYDYKKLQKAVMPEEFRRRVEALEGQKRE